MIFWRWNCGGTDPRVKADVARMIGGSDS